PAARPTVRIDRPAAVQLVHPEVKVRAGRGPGHSRDPDHLAPLDVLAFRDTDMPKVSVEGHQAIAVVDLDRLPGKTCMAPGHEPVGEDDAPRRGSRHRLVVQAVVVAV